MEALVAAGTGDPRRRGGGRGRVDGGVVLGAAAVDVVGTALQLHGGIGYTWESVHAFLKRATLDRPFAHRWPTAGVWRRYGSDAAA